VISTAFSWRMLEVEDDNSASIIMGIWYSALLLALGTIATASQQAVMLTRLNTYTDSPQRVRKMLGKLEGGSWKPRKMQLFIWQSPVMLQNASIYMFIAGLVVLVWKSAMTHWSADQLKVSCIFVDKVRQCLFLIDYSSIHDIARFCFCCICDNEYRALLQSKLEQIGKKYTIRTYTRVDRHIFDSYRAPSEHP
jgi:hypothetical protein